MTKIEFYEAQDPRYTGWYINEYEVMRGTLARDPCLSVGPYESQAEAMRFFHKTGGKQEELEHSE